MKIKTLATENFKALPDGRYELGQVTAIIGPNGRGKTSLQNALRYALNGKLPEAPIRTGEDHLRVSVVIDDGQDTEISRWNYLSDTYKINGEEVKKEAFARDVEKYKALAEANGFVLKLLGNTNPYFRTANSQAEFWEFLTTGKVEGAKMKGVKELEVEAHDGKTFYSRRSQPSKVTADGRRTTAKAVAELLGERMGGDEKALDIVTSSATMGAMDSAEFAKYLVGVVPVKIDFDKAASLAGLTKEEKKALEPFFPAAPNPVTVADVADAYKAAFAKRAEIGREMDEWKKRSTYYGPLPAQAKDEILRLLDENRKAAGASLQIAKAKSEYVRLTAERNRAILAAEEKRKELEALGNPPKPDRAEADAIDREEADARARADSARINGSRLEQANRPLEKMLAALDATVCPLCDTLTCTTDKTSCRKDLEAAVAANAAMKADEEKKLAEAEADVAKAREAKADYLRRERAYQDREAVARLVEALEKAVPAQPTDPGDAPDVKALEEESAKLAERLREANALEECEKAAKRYEEVKERHAVYDSAVRKAEPKKGTLTNAILGYVLKPFRDHANGFLQAIHGDAEVKFVTDDDGLQLYCRPHGRQGFLPLKALSTGEKLLVTFALMDMVATASNSRIVCFDCAEQLDDENLVSLLELLTSDPVRKRYDHALVSVVGHPSVERAVRRFETGNGLTTIRL